MLNKLILILYPLVFVSCVSLSTIEIQVLEPAASPVVPGINSVIILNRTIIGEVESDNFQESYLPHDNVELYNKASTEIIFSLADILNESPGIDRTGESRLLEMSQNKIIKDPEILEPEFIVFICDSLNANAVLSLEYLRMELPDKITLSQRSSEAYIRNYYVGEIALEINALWRVYRSYDGDVEDEYLWSDTLIWRHASFIANEIPDFIPGPEEATLEAAYYTALAYARRISPYWIVDERNYFSRGNRKLRKASNYIENDQLNEAEVIYKELLERRNKNVVAAAAYNLAYINEIRGDYREALSWVKRSYNHRSYSLTAEYIEILEERLEKSRELDRQLGKGN